MLDLHWMILNDLDDITKFLFGKSTGKHLNRSPQFSLLPDSLFPLLLNHPESVYSVLPLPHLCTWCERHLADKQWLCKKMTASKDAGIRHSPSTEASQIWFLEAQSPVTSPLGIHLGIHAAPHQMPYAIQAESMAELLLSGKTAPQLNNRWDFCEFSSIGTFQPLLRRKTDWQLWIAKLRKLWQAWRWRFVCSQASTCIFSVKFANYSYKILCKKLQETRYIINDTTWYYITITTVLESIWCI